MQTLIEVNTQILKNTLLVLISPFFWVLVGIIAYQYVRMSRLKE